MESTEPTQTTPGTDVEAPPAPVAAVSAPPSLGGEVQGVFAEIFSLERGLWPTVRDTALRPRRVINAYISHSKEYLGPFKVLIIFASLQTILYSFFFDLLSPKVQQQLASMGFKTQGNVSQEYFTFTITNYAVLAPLFAIAQGWILSLEFRKKSQFPIYHIAILCYSVAITFPIDSVFIYITASTSGFVLPLGIAIFDWFLSAIIITRFYEGNHLKMIFKVFLVIILSNFLISIMAGWITIMSLILLG